MKQLIQSISTGELSVRDIPAPRVLPGGILVRTRASLVSAGTERNMASFAQKNLLQKARSRPDLVRQTIEKARRDGILDTIDAVRNRLDQLMPLGYSAAGEVIEVGSEVSEFKAGDRVACAGGGFAVHAEIISVPRNLAVVLPEEVPFDSGAFCTLGAIALHGIRLADPRLGEVVAVVGLGILGLLTVQMLKAAGCVVAGLDIQQRRADMARSLGADWAGIDAAELTAAVASYSGGHGADAVLITADTQSNEPVELAGQISRNRGVVISVGAVGTTIPRKIYFEKELEFRVSRSYGPGRYDPDYEEKGHDYPYGYVRWTENRNMQAFARMMAAGQVDVEPLISHRFDIADGSRAYDLIMGKTGEPFVGVVLTYPRTATAERKIAIGTSSAAMAVSPALDGRLALGILGAGAFANSTLLPVLRKTAGAELIGIASGGGVTARNSADRYGFTYCATSSEEILADPNVNTVAILTRHHLHARQAIAALRAGKHVFVEKPLCLTGEELDAIGQVWRETTPRRMLTVGFNRRFAPFVVALRDAFREVDEPLFINCRVNAGFIPPEHWIQDPEQGGGRLIGEGCHFIDLLAYIAGQRIARISTRALPNNGRYSNDNLLVTAEFANGTIGTVSYVANGSRAFGKELVEVFGGGVAARMDDYRTLYVQREKKATRLTSRLRQDKGHRAEWEAIARHLTAGGPAPIAFDDVIHSTRATLAAAESLRRGVPIDVV